VVSTHARAQRVDGVDYALRSIWDEDGPAVAREFYETLLAKEVIDADAVAYALDEAVFTLKGQGVSPTRWASFIHVGA
jgi:CHAT domain-containing protein